MRLAIDRDGVCTEHETTDVSGFSSDDRRPGILCNTIEGPIVSLTGTRDEVRALGRRLLELAGADAEEYHGEARGEQRPAAKSAPLGACRIPKTAMRRQGFLRPVKAKTVIKSKKQTRR